MITPKQIDSGTFIGYQDNGTTECFWIWMPDSAGNEEYWILRNGVYVWPGSGLQYTALRILYMGSKYVVDAQNPTAAKFKTWVKARTGVADGDLTCLKHVRSAF